MKTILEDFKDRSELFRWAADRKPIYCGGTHRPDAEGVYRLIFQGALDNYKKVIEIETETISESHDLTAFLNSNNQFHLSLGAYDLCPKETMLSKFKLTATIEKCKETGEIVSKEFKLEKVE
jgi:hypothetical protein